MLAEETDGGRCQVLWTFASKSGFTPHLKLFPRGLFRGVRIANLLDLALTRAS